MSGMGVDLGAPPLSPVRFFGRPARATGPAPGRSAPTVLPNRTGAPHGGDIGNARSALRSRQEALRSGPTGPDAGQSLCARFRRQPRPDSVSELL